MRVVDNDFFHIVFILNLAGTCVLEFKTPYGASKHGSELFHPKLDYPDVRNIVHLKWKYSTRVNSFFFFQFNKLKNQTYYDSQP